MRAGVYYKNDDVRVEERPRPSIGAGEMLVRVEACGVCGSDVMEWYRIKRAPLVLGHELTGTVEELGEGVEGLEQGERVFVSHHVPCNACVYCLRGQHTCCETLQTTNVDPGGFCEFVRAPRLNVERGVIRLAEGMSFDEGTFLEPLACVLRAQKQAGVGAAKCVLVLGSGISGLLHIALARAKGAGPIVATDVNPWRLGKAEEFGADVAVDANEDVRAAVFEANGGRGADIVMVCAGVLSALRQAVGCVDRGGTIVTFAVPPPGEDLPVPVNRFWRNSITLTTSYAGSPADLAEAAALIARKVVPASDMITHVLPLSRIGEGFRLVAGGAESIKVVIHPQE